MNIGIILESGGRVCYVVQLMNPEVDAPTLTAAAPAVADRPSAPAGFRWTRQRREVYGLLIKERDHPTAAELFLRAKAHIPGISLGTVYHCLEALTQAGLIKKVNIERNPSRYCPNLSEHAHLIDERSGTVVDIELRPGIDLHGIFRLPAGARISRADICLKGSLPAGRPRFLTHPHTNSTHAP